MKKQLDAHLQHGTKTEQTRQLLEHGPSSVQVPKVLASFCNTDGALTLPTAATKGLRKWTILGLEARKGRKWKQRPFVGKGKERRKGRGWGAAPISSAPGRSGKPGGFLQGTRRGRMGPTTPCRPPPPSTADAQGAGAAGHRAQGGAPHFPSPRPTPPGAGLPRHGRPYLGPVPRRHGRPHRSRCS